MTRHAKASSAGSTQGQGRRPGSFVRGADAIRGCFSGANESGAQSISAARLSLALCFCIAALLALCAPPALAAQTHPYTGTSFGPDGVGGTESFERVQSIAVDSANGDTYVYDGGAGKVYKFDSAGAPVNFAATGTNAISVGGTGPFATFEIALAPAGSPGGTAGDIYVANASQAIHIYSAAGAELGEIPQGEEVCGVATDPSGNVYAGVLPRTINKFTPSANPPVETDKSGTGTVSQSEVCNVAADGLGNVYAANYGLGGIYKLEGIADTTPTQIDAGANSRANTMAIAPGSNDLYADQGNEVIQYDSSGTPIGSFAGGGDISESRGVAVNAGASKIYVGTPTTVKVFGPAITVPDAVTEGADAITKTTATLHGTVGAAGGPDATCVFQYTSASEFNEHGFEGASEKPCSPAGPFSGTGTTPVSATATGLSGETGYRFRLLATSSNGSNGGLPRSFQTPGAVNLLTDPATNITTSGATLNGTVNPEGIELEECAFEYRSGFGPFEKAPCAESPAAIGSGNAPVSVHLDLSGLASGTEYQFRLIGKNELGTSQGIESSFKAKGPSVGSVSVGGATETSATFHATINPNGVDTSYAFEYVTLADFESNGFAGATSVPAGGEDIGAGTGNVEVSATAGGLEPRSDYRFRVSATSADGTTRAAATAFATYGIGPVFGSCPNDRFRTGPSAKLPDCRAYERATPGDKYGSDAFGNLFSVQASPSGDAITSFSLSGFPGPESFQSINVLMSRFADGKWSTAGLSDPYSYGDRDYTLAWTSDLRLSFGAASHTSDNNTDASLVMRDSVTGERTVLIPQGVGFDPGFATVTLLGGVFDNDSKVLFAANGNVPVTSGPAPRSTKSLNVYLYDRGTGELTLAGLLPDSACASPPCVPANGSEFPLTFGGFTQDGHVVSSSGDVYFIDGSGKLYLRRDVAGPDATTVQVSASHKTEGGGPGGVATNSPQPLSYFYGATPDGSKAFFTSNEELTNDANTGPEPPMAIGRANIDGSSPQPSFIPTTAKWTAVDSGHVYWTNTKAGTIGRADIGGANPESSFITGLENPEGIAVDSGHIYWAEGRNHEEGHGTIGRATLTGTSVEKEFITGAGDPHGVAVSSEYIYWTNGTSTDIGRATITGANPEQSFVERGGGEHPWGIAVNATNLYWIDQEEGETYVIKVNTNGSGENYEGVGSQARGIAIDSNYIYSSDVSNGRIGRQGLNFESPNSGFITGTKGVFGVAVDAGHVYWAADPSAGNPPPNPGNDLYRYDRESGGLIDLAPDSSDLNGAQVVGVLGSSDNGNSVYFAANGDLDGAGPAASGDCLPGENERGSCSIYLWQAGGTGDCATAGGCISFVARVGAERVSNWWGGPTASGGLNTKISRVNSDGSTLVFGSQRQLTSYDNQGTREFYRYDAASGQITCLTCNPSGAPPVGAPGLKANDLFHAPSAYLTYEGQPFLSRNLSPNGKRFFFQSTDKLVPADVNGEVTCSTREQEVGSEGSCLDVYEWEAPGEGTCTENDPAYSPANGGCIYLLSTGTGRYPSYLADVSESGDVAFIFSRQQLVPADEDVQEDIYAVKVDGGLAADHETRPANCEGDACRGASSKPSNAPGAGTAAFEGPGNPKSNTNKTRCPKGKRTVHSKGKVRCVAKKHKKAHKHKSKSHKRAANNDRRASR